MSDNSKNNQSSDQNQNNNNDSNSNQESNPPLRDTNTYLEKGEKTGSTKE